MNEKNYRREVEKLNYKFYTTDTDIDEWRKNVRNVERALGIKSARTLVRRPHWSWRMLRNKVIFPVGKEKGKWIYTKRKRERK